MSASYDRLYHNFLEEHRKNVFVEVFVPSEGWLVEPVERATIVSAALLGDYSYRSLYLLTLTDGQLIEARIDYFTVKTSAESYKNLWAIELMKLIEPLHNRKYQ